MSRTTVCKGVIRPCVKLYTRARLACPQQPTPSSLSHPPLLSDSRIRPLSSLATLPSSPFTSPRPLHQRSSLAAHLICRTSQTSRHRLTAGFHNISPFSSRCCCSPVMICAAAHLSRDISHGGLSRRSFHMSLTAADVKKDVPHVTVTPAPPGSGTTSKSTIAKQRNLPPDATTTAVTSSASDELHEQVLNLPNILTFSRLAVTPVIGYVIYTHGSEHLAASLFLYAAVTDLLDGALARRWGQRTVVGSVVDPMADKALMTVVTVALASTGALPAWLAVVIVGRDVGLALAAFRIRWSSLPPPKTWRRYWDFSLPSAEVRPTMISKWNTALQLALLTATIARPLVEPWSGYDLGVAMQIMHYVVATTTIWSGMSYVFSKDAVRIVSKKQ